MSTTMEEIRSALSAVPADARAVWVTMGMALRSELDEAGRDLWMAWSQTSERYREADALAVWRSIRPTGGITIRSLFRAAIDHGWRPTAQGTVAPIIARVAPAASYRPWADLGAYLWEQSQPLRGSLAEVYLRHRGCRMPPADGDLRYLPARGDHPAALVARITDIITGAPTSLHLTRLTADGSGRGERRLLAGCRKAGGVIRLWPDEAVTHGLAVAEGIESALCAGHAYSPVWSAIDSGNLAAFPLLAGVESLTVFADHDPAGMRAARAVAQRWADAGRDASITMPIAAGADLNDVVAS